MWLLHDSTVDGRSIWISIK